MEGARLSAVGKMYREEVDSAPPQAAALTPPAESCAADSVPRLSGLTLDELYQDAQAECVGLTPDELAAHLIAVGVRHNYGQPPGHQPTRGQISVFWRSLQLPDLALAHACALGRDIAWQEFLARYRQPLTQAAIGIAGSIDAGTELADDLYSEIFGITRRDGERRSPLDSYAGRGSLKGYLRAILAQRNVDRHRRTHRETPLPVEDLVAPPPAHAAQPETLRRLVQSLAAILASLLPEERFLLSAWFLDQRTLLEIAQLLRVHESTISRRIQRLTTRLHQDLLRSLQSSGMSKRAAEESLGTDPRDIDMNLRSLLQSSRSGPFLQQGPAETSQT